MDTENAEQRVDPAAAEPLAESQTGAVNPATGGTGGPTSSSACDDVAGRVGRIEKSLERIVDHLYQTHREEQIREFSLSHLAGALCLVVSVVFVIGAVLSLLRADIRIGMPWATVAFLGAIAMQGLSLTLFTLSRRK